ncbi:MAG: pyridoxamine 5'-phosphate oxidase family protein [Oscillospiraceae bacterium]
MRKKEREMTDRAELLNVMAACDSCSVAFFDEEYPYVIPMNFGICDTDGAISLVFHGANVGHKLDLLRQNPKVGFEMSTKHVLSFLPRSCDSEMKYESVCGNGTMEILPDDQKIGALTALMNHYGRGPYDFDSRVVSATTVLKLTIYELTGKYLR